MNQTEIEKLQILNDYAKSASGRVFSKKLFYAVKSALLQKYSVFAGYDKQVWYDFNDWCKKCGENRKCEKCDLGWHAEHIHILKRFDLNGTIFHSPTNEFYYFNFEYQSGKCSDLFSDFADICKITISGKKEYNFSKELKTEAIKALKYFIKNYRIVLHSSKEPMTQKDWQKIGQAALF